VLISVNSFTVEHEWRFPGKGGVKIADIAILTSDRQPIVLFELKDADGKKKNDIQIEDYCRYISGHATNTQLVFLSRSLAYKKDEAALDKWVKKGVRIYKRRFYELHRALTRTDPMTRMLKEYLEDIGVGYVHDVDARALSYFTAKSLSFPTGPVKASEVASTPKLLNALLGNIGTLGDWVQAANRDLFKQTSKRHIYPWRYYDSKEIISMVNESLENGDAHEREWDLDDYVSRGTLYFTSQGYLKVPTKHWTFLELGYFCELARSTATNTKGTRPTQTFGIYATLKWNHDEEFHKKIEMPVQPFPDEKLGQETIRKCLRSVFRRSIKAAPSPIAATLRKFQIPSYFVLDHLSASLHPYCMLLHIALSVFHVAVRQPCAR
jgi:hypothetical protein